MLLLLAAAATAAPVFTDMGLVLRAPDTGPFAGGISAPTIAWDGTQWVMFFEAPIPRADRPDGCDAGAWIGRATSPDGLIWAVGDAPVLMPDSTDPTSAYSCSVYQPAVLYDGAQWHMFFTMGDEAMSVSSGIGWATSADGVAWEVRQAPAGPAILVPDGDTTAEDRARLGQPSAVLVDGLVTLLYAGAGAVYQARLAPPGGTWELVETPVLAAGEVDWAMHSLFSPSVLCDDEGGLTAIVGGFAADAATRSWGLATSADGASWTLGAAPLPIGADYNHVDVMYAGEDVLMFYSMTDPDSDLKAVGLAASGTTWGEPDGRFCSTAPDGGDTGDTGDTGPTVDTAVDDEDDGEELEPYDPTPEQKGGCGCDAGSISAPGTGLLLAAAALARRRRRG